VEVALPAGSRPLSSLTRVLSDVCMGRTPADLVITGGRLVNVHTREVLDGVDVAVKEGRVAMFGDAGHTRGPETEVLDAEGAYLVPGLIDTHLHVESAMVTVARFAEAVLPHGTTTAGSTTTRSRTCSASRASGGCSRRAAPCR
jgi:adenine deaminase